MNLHTQHLQLVLTSSNSVDVKLSGLCGHWLYHPSTHPSLHPSICTFIPTTNLQVFINFSLYPSPQVTKTNTVSSRQARELIFLSLCQYPILFIFLVGPSRYLQCGIFAIIPIFLTKLSSSTRILKHKYNYIIHLKTSMWQILPRFIKSFTFYPWHFQLKYEHLLIHTTFLIERNIAERVGK